MAVEDNVQRWYATGKRKTAVARVWIKAGTGNIAVNRRTFEAYFPRETSRLVVMQPFDVTEQVGRFDVFATLAGGGISAQAEALRHGISKALLEYNVGTARSLEARGVSHARRTCQRTEEVWTARGAQALPILQAVSVADLVGAWGRAAGEMLRGKSDGMSAWCIDLFPC